ncbi:uncharacterized protein [Periplaneta americana]|uniref:uncharacterized protein n=1 Tax=Periplaneta americana TaxID=6978 RepID=UPI0037E8FB0A
MSSHLVSIIIICLYMLRPLECKETNSAQKPTRFPLVKSNSIAESFKTQLKPHYRRKKQAQADISWDDLDKLKNVTYNLDVDLDKIGKNAINFRYDDTEESKTGDNHVGNDRQQQNKFSKERQTHSYDVDIRIDERDKNKPHRSKSSDTRASPKFKSRHRHRQGHKRKTNVKPVQKKRIVYEYPQSDIAHDPDTMQHRGSFRRRITRPKKFYDGFDTNLNEISEPQNYVPWTPRQQEAILSLLQKFRKMLLWPQWRQMPQWHDVSKWLKKFQLFPITLLRPLPNMPPLQLKMKPNKISRNIRMESTSTEATKSKKT